MQHAALHRCHSLGAWVLSTSGQRGDGLRAVTRMAEGLKVIRVSLRATCADGNDMIDVGVVRVEVSVPYIAALIADGGKYYVERKHIEDDTERRRSRAPRGPSLRSLVRLARKCDSAEQFGERLKRRYDRRQRQIERGRSLQD